MTVPNDPRAEEIFHAARDLGPDARARLLDEECGDDLRLRREVFSLLEQFDQLGDFLESPAIRPLEAPRGIGPYRLHSPLGRGGMGEVWLAEQEEPIRRKVAIKLIRPGMDSQEIVARFEAERQAMAMMNHPGVARVYDAGTTGRNQPYFVMEYVEGEPLTDYARAKRLPVRDRVVLFQQVCGAIQHAHQKTILHRDIKPSNVLVTEIDGRPLAKVIDFGVAKALGDRIGSETLLTRHGNILGTPEYMSPEQAGTSKEAVDTRSDVYSLGVLLYELLVGGLPYDASSVRDAMSRGSLSDLYRNDPPRPGMKLLSLGDRDEVASSCGTTVSGLESELRGELEWIVMTALSFEPGRRYQSAAELAEDLQRYLDGESVVAAPPSRSYRARKFVRRHRAAVATIAVIGFGLVLGAAGLAYGLVRALDAEGRASREARTSGEITEFLVDLFQVNSPGAVADTLVTAREILDRGAGTIRERLGDDPLVRGNLLNSMSKAYWGLGLYSQADTLASQAVDDLESVLESADPRLADARRQWSQSRFYAGDYHGALDIAEEAYEIHSARHGPYDENSLELRNVRAQLIARIGDPEAAQAEFLAMIQYLQGGTGAQVHRSLVTAWNNLASSRYQQADYEGTAAALGRALAVLDSTGLDDEPRRIQLMMNISVIRARLDDIDAALAMLERAIPEIDRVFGPNHMEAVGARMNHAAFLQFKGDLEGSIAGFEDVLPRAEAALGPDHPQVAAILHNLAGTLVMVERYEEAAEVYPRAIQIRATALGPEHDDTLRSMLGLATAEAGSGDVEHAREIFAEFRGRLEEKGGSNHPKVAEDLESYADVMARNGLERDASEARRIAESVRRAEG